MGHQPELLSLTVKTTRAPHFRLTERDISVLGGQGYLLALLTERSLKGPRWTMVPARFLAPGEVTQERLAQDSVVGSLILTINERWSSWILDAETWLYLLQGELGELRDRVVSSRHQYPRRSSARGAMHREGALALAFNDRRMLIDRLAKGDAGGQVEDDVHRVLLEEVLREIGYDILPSPVGVPVIRAELRGMLSAESCRQRVERWVPDSPRLVELRDRFLALTPEELEEVRWLL